MQYGARANRPSFRHMVTRKDIPSGELAEKSSGSDAKRVRSHFLEVEKTYSGGVADVNRKTKNKDCDLELSRNN